MRKRELLVPFRGNEGVCKGKALGGRFPPGGRLGCAGERGFLVFAAEGPRHGASIRLNFSEIVGSEEEEEIGVCRNVDCDWVCVLTSFASARRTVA